MSPDLIATLVGILSIVAGGIIAVAGTFLAERFRHRRINRTKPYNERIGELTASLTTASSEIDRMLVEMADIIKERQSAVSALEQQQIELQQKIDSLKNIPVEAAEFFTKYLASQEQKSSRRDYRIFALGVITTTIISVIIAVVLHFILR
jgi:predicted PurR-regulated permease PerM